MPPLNPTVASAPPEDTSPQSSTKRDTQRASPIRRNKIDSQLAAGPPSKSDSSEEINANEVAFPSEESFHLPEPIVERQVERVDHVSVQDRLKLHCYIRQGDFDIVWPNVVVFAIAHVLHVHTLYSILTSSDRRVQYTWIFSKFEGEKSGDGRERYFASERR